MGAGRGADGAAPSSRPAALDRGALRRVRLPGPPGAPAALRPAQGGVDDPPRLNGRSGPPPISLDNMLLRLLPWAHDENDPRAPMPPLQGRMVPTKTGREARSLPAMREKTVTVARHLLQRRAQAAVQQARHNGRLPMLDGKIRCVDCGQPAEVYDHRDYRKPLTVDPVCRSCDQIRGEALPLIRRSSQTGRRLVACGACAYQWFSRTPYPLTCPNCYARVEKPTTITATNYRAAANPTDGD